MDVTLSEQILKFLFRVQGYSIVSVQEVFNQKANREEIELGIQQERESTCPICGLTGNKYRYDSQLKRIYVGSVLCKAVYVVFRVYRVKCPDCGVLTDRQTISEGKSQYSKSVPSMLLEYTKLMDNASVSSLLGISKSTVYRMDSAELEKLSEEYESKIPQLRSICVDEISHRSGHNYATVVTNQDDGKVVWLEPGRSAESLVSAYKKYPDRFETLSLATMDFWKPFETATNRLYPDCKIIYDRFHLSRLIGRAIESERREYQNELSKEDRKYIKKHTRWVLLRRFNNCNDKQIDRLEELREANEWLYNLYLLKEDFLAIFDEQFISKELAKEHILSWTSK
ncbi:MAG: ISL3 family transposase, partial [Candidatus Cloacimonas sp.]|nr:ISL3 family transposase [Candidatus Cloacimonadota bacterium]